MVIIVNDDSVQTINVHVDVDVHPHVHVHVDALYLFCKLSLDWFVVCHTQNIHFFLDWYYMQMCRCTTHIVTCACTVFAGTSLLVTVAMSLMCLERSQRTWVNRRVTKTTALP